MSLVLKILVKCRLERVILQMALIVLASLAELNRIADLVIDENWQVIALHEVEDPIWQLILGHLVEFTLCRVLLQVHRTRVVILIVYEVDHGLTSRQNLSLPNRVHAQVVLGVVERCGPILDRSVGSVA